MKMRDECLPCLVNQIIKVAKITNAPHKKELYQKVFQYLSTLDFEMTNPEIIGCTFQLLKEHIGNDDPYFEIRKYYNQLFLKELSTFETRISQSDNSFEESVKYAILGNIIDFNPIHNQGIEHIMETFDRASQLHLTINHVSSLMTQIRESHSVLYLGDNCGEICLDLLLIKKMKEMNPNLDIYFGVRGEAVVNDSIEEDAYFVGIDQYATIISNGDQSLGTILHRCRQEFLDVYEKVDFVITKGQANYESLSEQKDKTIYFLLMVKCAVIADDIGVNEQSLICLNSQEKNL